MQDEAKRKSEKKVRFVELRMSSSFLSFFNSSRQACCQVSKQEIWVSTFYPVFLKRLLWGKLVKTLKILNCSLSYLLPRLVNISSEVEDQEIFINSSTVRLNLAKSIKVSIILSHSFRNVCCVLRFDKKIWVYNVFHFLQENKVWKTDNIFVHQNDGLIYGWLVFLKFVMLMKIAL